jgi:hypothetical protein
MPNGSDLRFRGVEGALPDILASIRYDDEQMAARFLGMFTKLGTTETGSRTLGQTLVDFFALAQDAVAKQHAGSSVVDLTLTADENRLRVEIDDDGAGGACVGSGSRLVGLIDRVEALGGRLRLHSPPGAGTTVTITLPLGATGSDPVGPAPRPEPPAERWPRNSPADRRTAAPAQPQPRSRIRRDPSGTPFRWQTPRISRHPAPCRRPSPGAPVPACSGPGSSRRRPPSR